MTRTIYTSFPKGTRVTRPAGGFVLWLELPARVNSRELLSAALKRGVCFVPGDVFSASKRYTNYLRLSCGHRWDRRMERGVQVLGELASSAAREAG